MFDWVNIKCILLIILIIVMIYIYRQQNIITGSYEPNQYANFENLDMLYISNKNSANIIPKKFTEFHKKLIKQYPIMDNKKIKYIIHDKKSLDNILKNIKHPTYTKSKEELIKQINNDEINGVDDFKKYWGNLTKGKCIPKTWGNNLKWENVKNAKYYELLIFMWSNEHVDSKSLYRIINESMWKYEKIDNISYSLDKANSYIIVDITTDIIKILIDGLDIISKMDKFKVDYPIVRGMTKIDTLLFGKIQEKILNNKSPIIDIDTFNAYTININKTDNIIFQQSNTNFGNNEIHIDNNNIFPLIPFSLCISHENEVLIYPTDKVRYKFEKYLPKKNKLFLSLTDKLDGDFKKEKYIRCY